MKIRPLFDDGTLGPESETNPRSAVGYHHRGARAGDVVGWGGCRYLVVEDTFGKRHEVAS